MKRWLSAAQRGIAYGMVGWTLCMMPHNLNAAIRTQLKYGYAVDRGGNRYSIWTTPAVLLALAAAAGGGLLIQAFLTRRAWDAGRGPAQAITYPLPKQGARKRARKRRRKR